MIPKYWFEDANRIERNALCTWLLRPMNITLSLKDAVIWTVRYLKSMNLSRMNIGRSMNENSHFTLKMMLSVKSIFHAFFRWQTSSGIVSETPEICIRLSLCVRGLQKTISRRLHETKNWIWVSIGEDDQSLSPFSFVLWEKTNMINSASSVASVNQKGDILMNINKSVVSCNQVWWSSVQLQRKILFFYKHRFIG